MYKMPPKLPTSVGIIMDGNRRWAEKHKLSVLEGHTNGLDKMVDVIKWVKDMQIRNLILYAFSNENWNRSAEEISFFTGLLAKGINVFTDKSDNDKSSELKKNNVSIRFVGQLSRFSSEIQTALKQIEDVSSPIDESTFSLWICLSYGGQLEIIEAAKKLQHSSIEITPETFRKAMWSADLPDPDLIIRTGGEMRLSGFLTYQSTYSELFFINTLWPDFSRHELNNVVLKYLLRERRFGL